jgi:dienelactone hydrolase
MSELKIKGITIVETFAEAFPMVGTRIVITAPSLEWALISARTATGFATSVIACGAEAGIERTLSPDETMDGRPGVAVLLFTMDADKLQRQLAAIDWMAKRPEIDTARIGAFGISRGGYSVMQLAGTIPDRVGAVVASAGHPFGYVMDDEEMEEFVAVRNERSTWRFGEPDGPPSFEPTSAEEERAAFDRWALSAQGLVDEITQPVLMINGKHDHLAPIGNIYFMLENGPATGRQARVYADDGHCAFKYFKEWAPASFKWLADNLDATKS